MRLAPPVSAASFTTPGLSHGTLLGDIASVISCIAKRAFLRVASGSRDESTKLNAACVRTRKSSTIPASIGLADHAGSAKRLSPAAGATTGSGFSPLRRRSMFMPTICSDIMKPVIHVLMRIGSIIASAITARSASPSEAGSTPVTSMP